jgi:hypothetical protein
MCSVSSLVDQFIQELENTLELCETTLSPVIIQNYAYHGIACLSSSLLNFEPDESLEPYMQIAPSVYKFKDCDNKVLRWVHSGIPEKKSRKRGRGWTPSEHDLFERAFTQLQRTSLKVRQNKLVYLSLLAP